MGNLFQIPCERAVDRTYTRLNMLNKKCFIVTDQSSICTYRNETEKLDEGLHSVSCCTVFSLLKCQNTILKKTMLTAVVKVKVTF